MKPVFPITDLKAFITRIDTAYFNEVINNVNDHVVRVSIMTSPYPWHLHPNSDETFICIDGILLVETPEAIYELYAGNTLTIPANTVHRTRPAGERSVNLTVEKREMQTVFVDDK